MNAFVAILALATAPPPVVYHYAPVYIFAAEGVLTRVGSFRYKALIGFEVLYCTIESTAHRTVTCVVHAPQDRLMLMKLEATEHKT